MIEFYNNAGNMIIDGRNPLMQLYHSNSWSSDTSGVWAGGFANSVAKINVPISTNPVHHKVASNDGAVEWWMPSVAPLTYHRFTSLPGATSGAGNAGIQIYNQDGTQIFDSRAPTLRIVDVLTIPDTAPGGQSWGYSLSNTSPPSTGLSVSGLPSRNYLLWAPTWRVLKRRQGTVEQVWFECALRGVNGANTGWYFHSTNVVTNTPSADGWYCSFLKTVFVFNVLGL